MKAVLTALALSATFALAQNDGFVIEGTVPEGVPEGAQVSARIVGESATDEIPEPLVSTEIVDGTFRLELPAEVDPSLLEEERLGCDGQDDTVELAYLPFLTVDSGGELAGALVVSMTSPAEWEMFAPPSTAYWVYLPEAVELHEECGSQSIDASFEAGWNHLLFERDGSDISISDEPAPANYSWHFQGP